MPTEKKTNKNNTANTSKKAKYNEFKPIQKGFTQKADKKKQTGQKVSCQNHTFITTHPLLFKNEQNQVLSPGQKKFNRQVKQLENLQKRIKSKIIEMDKMLDFYVKQIYPVQTEEAQISIIYVKTLYLFYKRKRRELSQSEHQLLGMLVKLEFERIQQEIIDKDSELQAIWKKLYKKSYEDSVAEDLNECKAEAIAQLSMMGVDFDPIEIENIKDFQFLNERVCQLIQEFLSQQGSELHKNMQEPFEQEPVHKKNGNHQYKQQSFDFGDFTSFDGQPPKKKTEARRKKELIAKEKEAIKQKSISSIYKQLAKLFHPDLERDESRKLEKEELMQQLTQAYKHKDLHTLLKLELCWIHKKEDGIQQMAEDKLEVYNEILKEQIAELKMEEDQIESHPKYEAIMSIDDFDSPTLPVLKNELRQLKRRQKVIKSQVEILNMDNPASIALLKGILHDFDVQADRILGLDDFFSLI